MINLIRHTFFLAAVLCIALTASAKTVLVLGDSISAAYGLQPSEGWVALMREDLSKRKPAVQVVNASVSGDTTANGLARLPALLKTHRPTTVVIALGGNDALRGQTVKSLSQNLETLVKQSQDAGAKSVILGLQIPPNFGPQYTAQFEASFKDVATKYKAALVPHLLAPLGTGLQYFQADKIHPTAAAQPLIWRHVKSTIESTL